MISRVMIIKIFVGCFLSLFLYHTYQFNEMILQSSEHVLQLMIGHLTDLQSYLRERGMEKDLSKLKVDDRMFRREEGCPRHSYLPRIIERSPLIIYIENFLTKDEIDHLIQLAEPLFKPSKVYDERGSLYVDQYRTSTSALLKRHQTPIIKCLEQRFAQFEGGIDLTFLEPLQVVKYEDDQEYKPHYDWFSHPEPLKNGGQRVTTFFSYLQANCSRGETEFVDIPYNHSLHQQFCDILVCDENSSQHGIRFRPLVGNTIFWYNMDEQGQVDYLTFHAAHPPGPNGNKIGLNTWTRLETFHPRQDK